MLEKQNTKKLTPVLRVILEVGFIVFIFYSNLLMGEFTRSGLGQSNGILWAIQDIFTITNFMIAIISGLIGYLIFEFFSNRL